MRKPNQTKVDTDELAVARLGARENLNELNRKTKNPEEHEKILWISRYLDTTENLIRSLLKGQGFPQEVSDEILDALSFPSKN